VGYVVAESGPPFSIPVPPFRREGRSPSRQRPILFRMTRPPRFPEQDECFLCNRPIRFNDDDFEVTVSFSELPKRAKRPSALLWAHVDCAREAAHDDFEFPPSPQS
jgi:hypothetical protein